MAKVNNAIPAPSQQRLATKGRTYQAVLHQTGTAAPTASVVADSISPYQSNNSITQQLVWGRTGVGVYTLAATPANPQYAAFPDINFLIIDCAQTAGTNLQLKGVKTNDNLLTFTQTTIDSPFTPTDGMTNVAVQIYIPH